MFCIALPMTNAQQTAPNTSKNELSHFFSQYAGFNDHEINSIHSGIATAKVLNSPPEQIRIFGAVYIKADPQSYLDFATDIEQTRKIPGYLAIQKFSDPPQLSDLDTFILDADDIKDLEKCKPNECEVQLPAQNIEEFRNSVNWKAPDMVKQINTLARQMALKALQSYIEGGNASLGTYRDKKNPNVVAESFTNLLDQAKALPVYMPDLHRYLLEYPNFKSPDIQSEFHWEKVKFGLKPTSRLVQRIIYKKDSSAPAYAVAEKQLYSSHYFQTALDVTVAVKVANQEGFYLITVKGSQQAGLTGFKGGIVRNVVVNKTKTSMESGLDAIKKRLENR
jgi:hypothetical protein